MSGLKREFRIFRLEIDGNYEMNLPIKGDGQPKVESIGRTVSEVPLQSKETGG